MDTVNADRSYGVIDDYQPSRGSGIGLGLEPSTLISILAFLAFLLHALLIVLIPSLKSFFSSPFFGYGYGNGIGYGNGFNIGAGSGINNGFGGYGGVPGIGAGFGVHGGGPYGGIAGFGGGSTGGGFGYGVIPTILGGVNGILGTGLLGTTNLLSTGLSGLFGPGVATSVGTAPVATTGTVAAGTPITAITRVVRSQDDDDQTRSIWQSEDKQIKPTSKIDESVITSRNVRNIKMNKLQLNKCNYYFCFSVR